MTAQRVITVAPPLFEGRSGSASETWIYLFLYVWGFDGPWRDVRLKHTQLEEGQVDATNTVGMLSQEATYINQNFSQQVLSKKIGTHKFKNPNPFMEQGDDVASVGYRYRKFE